MAAEVSYFSTETADTAFLNNFVIAASAALESGEYEKANALYTDLGEAWYEGERALAALAGTEGAHEPPEGSSLEADFKFAVTHSLGLMWEVIKPKLRVRLIPLNMEAIEKAYTKAATVAAARAAAVHPAQRQQGPDQHPLQELMGSAEPGGETEQSLGSFLDKITARMNSQRNAFHQPERLAPIHEEAAESGERQPGNGNDTPKRAPAVSDKLKHAAARLLVPGPPPLRQDERWGPMIALHILQEKSSITDWVDHQKLSGHNDREARTIARAMEVGVNEMGAGFLASKSAEVLLRRLLAITIAARSGSTAEAWRAASMLEDLPSDGLGGMLPAVVNKSLREQLKLELQLESMLAGKLPEKKK